MMDLAAKKKALRETCMAKRMAISDESWKKRSEEIIDHVIGSEEYSRASSIHCFVPMLQRKEVDTYPLLKTVIDEGKMLIVPRTNFADGSLHHVHLTSLEDLAPNKWGVPEPGIDQPTTTLRPELIFVPLLAVDPYGNRLGYGKGFYDRFLARAESRSFGLVFSELVTDAVPADENDQPLTGFFSEKGVHYSKLRPSKDVKEVK